MIDKETPEPLTETTTTVKIPPDPDHGYDAYTTTYGIRWRTTSAKTGRIAASALFDGHVSDPETGGVYSTDQRERLAGRLIESLGVWDDNLNAAILKCLNAIARTVMESCAQ